MGIIKKCGLYVPSLILLSMGLSVLLSVPSSAVSVYDDYYNTVPELELYHTELPCAVDPRNHSVDWSTLVIPSYPGLLTAIQGTGSWGVSALPNIGSGVYNSFIVYWNESAQMGITWHSWGYMQATNVTTAVEVRISGCDGSTPIYNVSNYGAGYISSNDGAIVNFIYTGDITYPQDYDGLPIVGEYIPPVSLVDFMSFTAEVNDKIITLWNTTPSPPLTSDDRCKFTLYDSTGTGDVLWDTEYASFCSQVHTIDIQKILNGSYGTYTIMLSVQRDTNSDGMPDIDVGYFQKPVVVDGSTYSMTAGHTFVDKSTDYEDCTTFGWDVAQRLTCEIGNATKRVTDFITGLFIPNRLLIQQKQDEFMSDLRSHIPAFVQTYTWLTVDLLQAFASGDEVVCNHSFGYFFGSEFVFNQCALEQKFPQIWAVVALVIRATVAFALIVLIYKKMKIIIYGERFHDKGAF